MHQSALALAPPPLTRQLPEDEVGFQLGWDHAQHGRVPAPDLLLAGTAISQGWRAARAVLGRRQPSGTRALRQWLTVRCLAWRQGLHFDTVNLTPTQLARLQTSLCPVRRQRLGGAQADADAPQFVALNRASGFRPGNVVMLSRAAALAAQDCSVTLALRQARAAEADGSDVQGLSAVGWRRLAVLLSFAQPLPFHEAARLPLLMLPPSGVQAQPAVQALQLMLTMNFARPGWSARTRSLAATLPGEAQRTEFHLFISALATRVLEAGSERQADGRSCPPRGVAEAVSLACLEDAWAHERVQRRWQHWVLGMGEAGCAAFAQRVRRLPGFPSLPGLQRMPGADHPQDSLAGAGARQHHLQVRLRSGRPGAGSADRNCAPGERPSPAAWPDAERMSGASSAMRPQAHRRSPYSPPLQAQP